MRGLSRAIVQGYHQHYFMLRDALMDAGDEAMTFSEGENYYIETLTKYYVGRVQRCDGAEVVLKDAAWIADTGLMTDFIKKGTSDNLEVEIIGEWHIPIGMITGKGPWPHPLFWERK